MLGHHPAGRPKHKDLVDDALHENKSHTHPASGMRDFDSQLSAKAPCKTVLTVGPAPADYVTDGTAANVQIQEASDPSPRRAGPCSTSPPLSTWLAVPILVPCGHVSLVGSGWHTALARGDRVNKDAVWFSPVAGDSISRAKNADSKITLSSANQTTGSQGTHNLVAVSYPFKQLQIKRPWGNGGNFLHNGTLGSFGHHNPFINGF